MIHTYLLLKWSILFELLSLFFNDVDGGDDDDNLVIVDDDLVRPVVPIDVVVGQKIHWCSDMAVMPFWCFWYFDGDNPLRLPKLK